jgi:hypothetical protein
LVTALLAVTSFLQLHAQLADITQPGDLIVATSSNSPSNEGVANAIDDQPTKYLNFDRLDAGFTVSPRTGLTLVQGLTLTSANDAPERDPASFDLSGSIDGLRFTRIASGPVVFRSRFDKQSIAFSNTVPYTTYRLMFPTVAGPGGNSMQISEVELLGTPQVISPGFLRFESYNTGGGNEVGLLTNHPSFPHQPREVLHLTSFDSRSVYPDDSHEGYGARISGYFIPEVSGWWIFYLRSDDTSVLSFNPNGMDPAGKIVLTQEPAWGQPFSAHASAAQDLVAGRAYYIEALYKEGIGGDYCQVAAKLRSDPTDPDTLSPIPGRHLATAVNPSGAKIEFIQQPASQVGAIPFADFEADFNASNGGFTVTTPQNYAGPWVYDPGSGSWRQDGQGPEINHPTTSILSSPAIRVDSAGKVFLKFSHRHSFETDGDPWDGGQVLVSRNGGPFIAVEDSAFTQNGYAGRRVSPISASILKGKPAFTGDSADYATTFITSIAALGDFEPGDTVQVQFLAAGDTNTGGKVPNWQIDSVSLTRHALLNARFASGSAGFTVTTPQEYAGPWVFDPASGSWRQDGQQAEIGRPTTSILTSPTVRISGLGRVLLSFEHRYSFESGLGLWDGGQVQVSRNGGPFIAVPDSAFVRNGYEGRRVLASSLSILRGQGAFTAESSDYATGFVTSIADLGEFQPGDAVQVQFVAAGDSNTGGRVPNWQINSVRLEWGTLPSPLFAARSLAIVPGVVNPPVSYQWEMDCGEGFMRIPGATSAAYSPGENPNLHGCSFRVRVFTLGASATSAPALLAIINPAFGVPTLTGSSLAPSGNADLKGIGTPGLLAGLATSTDLIHWTWVQDVVIRRDGRIQRTANTAGESQRFFLLDWADTQPFPQGLVAWWSSEDNHLDSYASNHGTADPAAPTFDAGVRGRSLRFDGIGQKLTVPASSIPVPWTAAFWVNREDATGASAAILADNETGLKLEQFASGRRMGYTRFGVADYAFDYILPANTWSHVAFVASASGTTLYVDGQLVGSLPDTVKLPLMTIGARPSGVDHLKGLLDEITIFDRALTPLEIRQVRNATDAH